MLAKALSLFILIFLLGRATLGQELSRTRSEMYLQRAQALELWREEAWLRLGHYQKHLWGVRSPFSGPFFIDVNGATDPRAELLATVRLLLDPRPEDVARYKMPPVCFFKARYRWLRGRLDLPEAPPCSERDAWKARLNARSVTLIFAASDLSTATSSFGHTFLKLSNPDNRGGKELLDYGLNYAAEANKSEGLFYGLKGLFGFYRGNFSVMPYHEKIRQYTNAEGRDLWEYPLRLTPDEVDLLVDHLLELEGSTAPYYFLSKNCSYEILRMLEVARPDISISQHLPFLVIPLDTVKHLVRETDLVEDARFRRSLKSDYLEHVNLLGWKQRRALAWTVEHLRAPDDESLAPIEKAALLETAMKFESLKAFEEERDLDTEKYKLSVQRARLGAVKELEPEPVPPPPDQSHDSSAIYIGRGERRHRAFTSFKFRTAFHDLEQNDDGAVKFSKSDILALEARRYETPERWSLQRMTWIDLLNTSPLNSLDHTVSWKARFETVDPWRSEIEGGAGYSIDVLRSRNLRARLVGLVTGQYMQDHLRAGPNGILIARVFDRLGLSLESGLYYSTRPHPETPILFAADVQLDHNWDLRFETRDSYEQQVRVAYNFLM